MKMEKRILKNKIEIRQENESENKQIQGFAVKYNKDSEIMRDWWGDEFVERFAPGAFAESLETKDQKALWNHNWDLPLGSIRANTLMINDESEGLRYIIDVPNNTWGNDAIESVGRGDVDGTSFGFRAMDDDWVIVNRDGKEIYQRTITKAELFEISPCTFPAYPDSTSSTRDIKCRDEVKNPIEERRKKLIIETYL